MVRAAVSEPQQSNDILLRRSAILQQINRLSNLDLPAQSRSELLLKCGEILLEFSTFSAAWVGRYAPDTDSVTPLSFLQIRTGPQQQRLVERQRILPGPALVAKIEKAIERRCPLICREFETPLYVPLPQGDLRIQACSIWPLLHHDFVYGVVALLCFESDSDTSFSTFEQELLETTVADLSLTLYAHDVSVQLKFERDFNREIIDTIQALMVSITPCGKIIHFNPEAERVTGYQQKDVLERYWVDILLSPDNRVHYQNVISQLLKENTSNLSFRAPLLTRDGNLRTIDWHSSIKSDIDKGTVGMVLFGLDITERLVADQKYDSTVAKWENIFSAIQDPALIVKRDGTIIDANHATFSASRRSRADVLGNSVCTILHGGRKAGAICPLEKLIRTGQSRILHTELSGLHGDYLLTVSPLKSVAGADEATLLVARDMTEEERHKAEAMRAAQLASIGELAAGVAHEINNPVNGILNYAQMLSDLTLDSQGEEVVGRIISDGKRIATIVRSLLDFSRHRVEEPEPVVGAGLLDDCLELVKHQLLTDNIILEISFPENLPLMFCNPSQLQQVLINVISNSRYALNKQYRGKHPKKKLLISGSQVEHGSSSYIRFTITDFGCGIEHHLLERVFDPFFSTKPNGEGTGLGLSISYGLVRDNGGYMRIKSLYNSYTTMIIDIPAADGEENG
jgi:PAS domain S-box-containing protein